MAKWTILSPIKLDGVRVKPGGKPVEIEDEGQVKDLVRLGCIEPAGDKLPAERPSKKPDRLAAIQAAMGDLDLTIQGNVTDEGAPDANVLTEALGWKVDAKERDEAWAAFQKDQGE